MKNKAFYAPNNGVLTRLSVEKRNQLLGEVTSLMLSSPLHRSYMVNDIGAMFLPPLHLNQFRIYRKGETPVGLVTWAWLTKPVEKKYVAGEYNLKPEDWNRGKQLWFVDFLTPSGHAQQIVQDLKTNIFPDDIAKAIRLGPDGKVRGIRVHHGVNRIEESKEFRDEIDLPEIFEASNEKPKKKTAKP